MIELKRLPYTSLDGVRNFAKGEAGYNRVAKLGIAEVDNKTVICFDNSEDEYGTMYIDLDDFKRIIQKLERQQEPNVKIVGNLTIDYEVQKLIKVRAGHPVFEINDRYFIESGNIRVPFSKDKLSPYIKFL